MAREDPPGRIMIRSFNSHLHILERPAGTSIVRIGTGVVTVTIEAEVDGCEVVISATASGPHANAIAGWYAFQNLFCRMVPPKATRVVDSWHHDSSRGWVRDDYEIIVDGVRHGVSQQPVDLEWRLTAGITEGP